VRPETKAILVNNPSNPCGSCWTVEHMADIVALSDELGIPLICDEVYYGLSFDPNRKHVSFSHFHSQVPMICIGSLSKNYCVPGWRCGWSLVYNTHGYFDTIMEHMAKHATILIHPNSLV